MINLLEYSDRNEILSLLAECMSPDESRVIHEYELYRNDKSKMLIGAIENDELIGLIGIKYKAEDEIELKHIPESVIKVL